jgi:hypothetical protein
LTATPEHVIIEIEGPMDVPIDKLRRCPIQLIPVARESLYYVTRRDAIAQRGILVPLLVRPVEDYYEVIADQQVFEIARDLGLSTVPCLVRELTDDEVLVAQVDAHDSQVNDNKSHFTVRLLKIAQRGMTLHQMASLLCWHPDRVKRILNLGSLCPRAQRDLEHGDLSLTLAEELRKLPVGRQDDLMDLNGKMPPTEYMEALRKETRQSRSGGRGGQTQQYRLRPYKEVEYEHINRVTAASVLTALEVDNLVDAYYAGVGWAMKADPLTQAEDQRKIELRRAKEAALIHRRIDNHFSVE